MAITMAEGVCLAVEVDPRRIQRRLETGYCDEMASTLDEALAQVREACDQGQPLSIGLIGNAAEVYPELVRRDIIPDLVTDQTLAHDALNGYVPEGPCGGRGEGAAPARSSGVCTPLDGLDGQACAGHAGYAEDGGHRLRLRQ